MGIRPQKLRSLTMPLYRRGPSLTIILCVLRSEARFSIFMVNHLEVINDTPDIFKQT